MKGNILESKELSGVLQPGLSMELFVKQGEYRGLYKTKIEDREKETLIIAVPYGEKGFLALHSGEQIELIFIIGHESYAFETEILYRQINHALPVFIIAEPSRAYRKQRRNYVRMECLINIRYQLLDADKKRGPQQEAQVLDISGGGFLLFLDQAVNENDKLLVQLSFDTELIEAFCIVRRVDEVNYNKKKGYKQYKVSLEFEEISERNRDKIIKHIFEIERDLRRRGLK